MAFMIHRLRGPVRLEDIAAAADMSSSQLCFLFRNTVGLTPSAYHRKMRLEAARNELLLPETGILVLRGLRVLVLRRIHRGDSLPRSQNNFLYPAWISGYSQDDVVELRPVQQRVQHVARKSGAELRHYSFIAGIGRNVNGCACPRLYGTQNLCQRGIRSIDRELAILQIDSRRGWW